MKDEAITKDMTKEEYIKYINEMLNQIENKKLIKDIYMLVQSCYLEEA
ncbi:MAG: hypothetical protein LUH02_07305 [Erysipelotrichaceae bacterium]|nr:hypothetical protein [Erysipelotrichaceae bacterium]